MGVPQSDTARRLFRALGREPSCGGGATGAVVYTYSATAATEPYADYVDAYNNYLRSVGNVQSAAPPAAASSPPRRLKARGPRRDSRGRYVAARAD